MRVSRVPFVRLGKLHIPDNLCIIPPNPTHVLVNQIDAYRTIPLDWEFSPKKLEFVNDMIVCPLHLLTKRLFEVTKQIRVAMQPSKTMILITNGDVPRHRDRRLWSLNCVIETGGGHAVVYDPFEKIEHVLRNEPGDLYIQNISLPHWTRGVSGKRVVLSYSIESDYYGEFHRAYPKSPDFTASTHNKKLNVY